MVIYIADRYGVVQTTASSDLPENKTLISDTMTDDLDSGVKTYECELIATDEIKADFSNTCGVSLPQLVNTSSA